MIIRGITTVIILITVLMKVASAQPTPSEREKITIEDLKPTVNYAKSGPFYQPFREKPGLAFLTSTIVPGSGQAANKKWWRAGLYFLAEAVFLGVHLKKYHDAKAEQRQYERFADNNWSVVSYAKWLVNYHDQNNLQNEYIAELREDLAGTSAAYDPDEDWEKIDLELLRNAERNTRFVFPDRIGENVFSHVMPEYGSQHYYELISKYYQYGSGWSDFGRDRNNNRLDNPYKLNWDGSDMPFNFIRGATMAETFNDSYRMAGNMVSLIILNHIVSAFDAFLTVKIKNNRLEGNTNLLNPQQTFSLKFHF